MYHSDRETLDIAGLLGQAGVVGIWIVVILNVIFANKQNRQMLETHVFYKSDHSSWKDTRLTKFE